MDFGKLITDIFDYLYKYAADNNFFAFFEGIFEEGFLKDVFDSIKNSF